MGKKSSKGPDGDRFGDKAVDVDEMAERIDPSPMLLKAQQDNRRLRKRVDHLKVQLGEREEFFDELRGLVRVMEPVVSPPKVRKGTRIGSPLTAVLVCSDWHIGEVIDYDEVEGFNEYNWIIASRRVNYLMEKFAAWVNMSRELGRCDEAVVVCIGDLISGDIHDELRVCNEFPVPVQVVRAGILLASGIGQIASEFSSVRVEFVAADNHSRLTKKPQYKQAGLNSYNYLVGFLARQYLQRHANVTFNLHAAIKSLVEIQGHKYLCQHGNMIRGWAGFPWYGADRQAAKETFARRHLADSQFHKMVIGHFHVPMNSHKFLVNGSLSGTSELDHGHGRYSQPCQIAWLAHPRYGELNWMSFNLIFADECDQYDLDPAVLGCA